MILLFLDNYISMAMFATVGIMNLVWALRHRKNNYNHLRYISAVIMAVCVWLEAGYMWFGYPHNTIGVMVTLIATLQLIAVITRYRLGE